MDDKTKDDDEGKKSPIDWSKATAEQLAAANAEAKRRQPLIGHEDVDWPALSGHEFARKRHEVFGAMRRQAKDGRTVRDHADLEALRLAGAKRAENADSE